MMKSAVSVLLGAILGAAAGCAGPEPRRAEEPAVVHHYIHEPWPYWGAYPYAWYPERTNTVYVPVSQPAPAAEPRWRLKAPKRLHVR